MSLLLDSHIILWWMDKSPKLPAAARTMIEATTDKVFVIYATLWEFAIKQSNGKLKMDVDAFHRNVATDGFTWLDIAPKHITMVTQLSRFDDHKDSFGRLLVAQSLSEPGILLTTYATLARYGTTVRVV